jgi:FkbM family methyltransferase
MRTRLAFDQILLVDDGSTELPDWPDTTIAREADGLTSSAKIVLYHFENRLGRLSVTNFPGWVRSFFFAARWAAANGFDRVIHVESDAFLISPRIQQYCNDITDGWIAPWCPRYQWPESAIQIIAGSALKSYLELADRPAEEWASLVIEKSLPFTHVEMRFLGDRLGDNDDVVPRGADWSSQAHCAPGQQPARFYWWLSGLDTVTGDVAAPPDPVLPVQSPTAGNPATPFSELAFHACLARPGTIIDVGANVGAFSRPFSTWTTHRLIAFEPFPPIFERLKANLIADHGGALPARVKLHMAALGDTPGTATMRVPNVAGIGVVHEWASLVKTFDGIEGVSVFECDVPVWTIDGLGLDDVTSIKIDAEGNEIEVLHGARHTIQRCRPVISCECEERHREGVSWYVPGFLRALGYDAWFYHQEQFWPVASLDRRLMQVATAYGMPESDPYIGMFIFIPRELVEVRDRLLEFGPFNSA